MPPRSECVAGTVSDVMLHGPKVWSSATTVAEAQRAFDDDHVHALLVLDGHRLVAVVERTDLGTLEPATPARVAGRLDGRLVDPGADAHDIRLEMLATGRRRLAVVDDARSLLGLLCLKRSGLGFCSDADVAARADERGPVGSVPRRGAGSGVHTSAQQRWWPST